MNKFDKEIIKLAKKSKIPDDTGYDRRIDSLIEALREKPYTASPQKPHSSLLKASAALCPLAAVILISLPVCAKLGSYVTERMQQMSEEELENYADAADEDNMTTAHSLEALTYSRELSEEERLRYDDLFEKYENEGLFPDHDLPVVDKAEGNDTITAPFYETYNYKYYLPDRTLTDEELLEMIDFLHKLDYATANTQEAESIRKEQQAYEANPFPANGDLSEETAIAVASSYLEKILNRDLSAMTKSAEFWFGFGSSEEGYGEYLVTFKADDDESYLVSLTRETGILTYVAFILEGRNYSAYKGNSVPVNEQLCYSRYEDAKAILTSVLPSEVSIVKGVCEYNQTETGEAEHGFLYYTFTLSNGYVYSVSYQIEDDIYPLLHLIDRNDNYEALPWTTVLPMEP